MRFVTVSLLLILGTSTVTTSAEMAGTPNPPLSDWSRVLRLAPGSPLTVLIPDQPPEHRVMVWADQSQLIVLNATAVDDRGARSDLLDFVMARLAETGSRLPKMTASVAGTADEAGLEQAEDHDDHGEHRQKLTKRQAFHGDLLTSG